LTREHFYHVGSTENLRHPMIEALITNFPVHAAQDAAPKVEQLAFYEKPLAEYSARGA
jgi:DNA adenine methylase